MNAIKKFLVASPLLSMPILWATQASVAFAQTTSNTINSPINNATGIQNLMCSIVSWFIWIVILVSVIMVVFAAFEYATAGDDTEKVERGRKTLTYAAVGIIVALCAAGFPAIVQSVFGSSSTGGISISCLGGSGSTSSGSSGNSSGL
jgi:heme/copper-type cytochrome/quinol oxidase subunit 2